MGPWLGPMSKGAVESASRMRVAARISSAPPYADWPRDNGITLDDVRGHAWFAGLDWEAVASNSQEMPFVPRLDGEDDLRHFEIEEADIIARKNLFEAVKLDPAQQKQFDAF